MIHTKGFTRALLKLINEVNSSCCSGNNTLISNAVNNEDTDIELSGDGRVSSPLTSSIIYTDSPSNFAELSNGLYVDGRKVKNIGLQGGVEYYRLPANFLSSSTESTTLSGAMTTAVVTAVGGVDKIAVTGGNYTSYVLLNSALRADSRYVETLRFKIDTLGSASIVGFAYVPLNQEGFDSSLQYNTLYFNLITKVFYWGQGYGVQPAGAIQSTVNSASGAFAVSGNTLEFTLQIEGLTGKMSLQVINVNQPQNQAVALIDYDNFGPGVKTAKTGFILTDGTYTILDYKRESLTPKNCLLYMMGDSMGSGYATASELALTNILNNLLAENVTCAASSGTNIYSSVVAAYQEINKLKPKTVLLFSYIPLTNGDFIVGNPRNALYMQYFNGLMKAIIYSGGVPILIKIPPVWAVYGNGNEAAWNAFIQDQKTNYYPTALILDISQETATYDSSGYHYNAAFYNIIAAKLIQLYKDNNYI